MNEDEWFRERSSLNHIKLSHKIKRILTTDNEVYINYAIAGKSKEVFKTPVEQEYYETINQSINAWASIRDLMIQHANKVFDEFMPYSHSLNLLSTYQPKDVIVWLRSIIKGDIANRFRLMEWVNSVNSAAKAVDAEFANYKNVTNLRAAVDKLHDAYSEKEFIK